MKLAELSTGVLYRFHETGTRHNGDAAVVLDTETVMHLRKRRHAPDTIELDDRVINAGPRRVPVLIVSGNWIGEPDPAEDYDSDESSKIRPVPAADVLAHLVALGEQVRPLLADGMTEGDVDDAARKLRTDGDQLHLLNFAMVMPKDIAKTWTAHEKNEARAKVARDERDKREAQRHAVQVAAYERTAPLVQAAFGIEPGTVREHGYREGELAFGPGYSGPDVGAPQRDRSERVVQVSWSELEAIVEAARFLGRSEESVQDGERQDEFLAQITADARAAVRP